MIKYTDYKIVESDHKSKFEYEVLKLLQSGYTPLGNLIRTN